MKNKILNTAVATMMIASFAIPAFAQTSATSTSPKADAASVKASRLEAASSTKAAKVEAQAQALALKLDKAMTAAKAKGDKEIDTRVTSLNTLITNVDSLKNVPADQKTAIAGTIQAIVTAMTNLKQDMDTTNSTTTLKTDLESVTTSYRIYALVLPQIKIISAADQSATVVNMLTAVSAKLANRLGTSTNVTNVADLQKTLADLDAKILDAKTRSDAAYKEVIALAPDQGDKTKMAANTVSLKDARSKIQTAQKDSTAARKDAETIIKALVKADKTAAKATPAVKTPVAATGTATSTQ